MVKMYRTSRAGYSEEVLPENIEEIFITLKEWREASYEDPSDATVGIRIFKNKRKIYSWDAPILFPTMLPRFSKFIMWRLMQNDEANEVEPESIEEMFRLLEKWQEDPRTKAIEIENRDEITVYQWARG